MKFVWVTLLLILFFQKSFGQIADQKLELFTYNIVFSGLTSGLGAVINSPKKSNKKKIFIKAFWQGGIGGILNFSGKEMLYLVNKKNTLSYAWPAKLLHSAGTSIVENAALNKPFLQNWHMNIGAFRFDFSTDKSSPFKIRLLPMSIYSLYWASLSGQFSVSKTIATGSIIFQNKDRIIIEVKQKMVAGASHGRATIIGKEWIATNKIIAHEIVHEYQFNEYQIFNTWLNPLAKQYTPKKIRTLFSKYMYADIPYHWALYSLVKQSKPNNHYRNFFEFEAESSATNKYIVR